MSYGLKYTVPFKTISGIDAVVNIEVKDYAGQVIELTGGATPFTIPTDESDLLTPIRASGATLSVFGSDYLRDLYTSDPQGVRITQYTNGVLHWIGFLTPDTFSQDFSRPEFIHEMECVSALSTLKYKEFDLTDDFVSFREIIEQACVYAGYDVIYLTNSVRTKNSKFYDSAITSANFFDELGEAMTYYKVLEEIAKFHGCTFTPFEDDLYLLDYAAIRSGYNSYTRISGTSVTNVTLSDLKTVTNYKGTGAKLSRIAGKNKAVVNCSLYETKDLLPAFDDEKSIFVSMRDDFTETVKEGKENVTYKGIIRYFNQPKYTFYKYAYAMPLGKNGHSGPLTDIDGGACFVKTAEFKTDQVPSKLNLSDEIQVRTYIDRDSALAGNHLDRTCPIIKITSDKKAFIHPNVRFCIGLSVKYQTKEWTLSRDRNETIQSSNVTQKAKFRIGEYYYNGSGWTTTESTFLMPFERKSGDKAYGTWFGLKNTNTYELGIGDMQGYTFKAPDQPILGECELTLYAYEDLPVSQLTTFGRQYVYYQNISLNYGIPNEQSIYGDWVNKDSKNDLIYENVIEGDYVEEADEIDLKICTNPDGKLTLSSVLEGNNFLEEIETDVFGTGQAEEILLRRVVSMFSKPRFVIDPILENNAKPYAIFTEPHLNKQFLVAGGEENVKMERTRYNLIEL